MLRGVDRIPSISTERASRIPTDQGRSATMLGGSLHPHAPRLEIGAMSIPATTAITRKATRLGGASTGARGV